MRRWKLLGLIIIVLALGGGAYLFMGRGLAATSSSKQAAVQLARVERGTLEATVNTSGSVVFPSKTQLSFKLSGTARETIREIVVKEGDRVEAGQVLARLNASSLERAVQQAGLNLRSAEVKLEKVLQPYTPSDITDAEQSLRSAKVALENADRDLEITRVSDTVGKDLRQAENEFNWYQVNAGSYYQKYQQGEVDYDTYMAHYNNLMNAQDRLNTARLKATNTLQSAENKVASAQDALRKAEETLAKRRAGPDPLDVELQRNEVAKVQANLEDARENLAAATIKAPFAGVVMSVAKKADEQVGGSDIILTLVDPSQVQVQGQLGEVDVPQVQVGREVRITFDALPQVQLQGKVSTIGSVAVRQQGVVGYPVTIDVSREMARSSSPTGPRQEGTQGMPGMQGTPGRQQGQQPQTGGFQRPEGGQQPTPGAAPQREVRLLEGMTALATIITERKENVLLVPNRALRTQGRQRVVQVMVNGQPQERPVRTGLANEQFTEIVEGIQEGDEVVLPGAVPRQPTPQPGGFGPGLPGMPAMKF